LINHGIENNITDVMLSVAYKPFMLLNVVMLSVMAPLYWSIRLGFLGTNGLAFLPVAPLTKKVFKDFSNRKKTVWGKNIKLIKENCQEKKEIIICLFIPFCTMPQNVSTCNKLQRFFNISQTFWLNKGR